MTVEARAEIVRLRAEGWNDSEIARHLNIRGIPTPSGRGRWHRASIDHHVNPDRWAAYMRHYNARNR